MWAEGSSDLLKAESWTRSSALTAPTNPVDFGGPDNTWQEGNVVEAPSGELWNVLRVNSQSAAWYNKAAVVALDQGSRTMRFKQWVDGPFGTSKFAVRRDDSARYYALSTNVTAEAAKLGCCWSGPGDCRYNLVLSTSDDLLHWRVCRTLLHDDTGLSVADTCKYTGFEYPDWEFDGPDLVAGVRTAYRGAPTSNSANRMLSMRVKDFRAACKHDDGGAAAGAAPQHLVWPPPQHIEATGPPLLLSPAFAITSAHESGTLRAAIRRHSALASVAVAAAPSNAPRTRLRELRLKVVGERAQDESLDHATLYNYTLRVGGGAVATAEASSVYGAMYAMETFQQLLDGAEGAVRHSSILVNDSPDYVWRGLMVDAGRRFFPVETLKDLMATMAAAKLNVLHVRW